MPGPTFRALSRRIHIIRPRSRRARSSSFLLLPPLRISAPLEWEGLLARKRRGTVQRGARPSPVQTAGKYFPPVRAERRPHLPLRPADRLSFKPPQKKTPSATAVEAAVAHAPSSSHVVFRLLQHLAQARTRSVSTSHPAISVAELSLGATTTSATAPCAGPPGPSRTLRSPARVLLTPASPGAAP